MTTLPDPPRLPALPLGFVVAMRARLTMLNGPMQNEWLVVSRWSAGTCLSIGRTLALAPPGFPAPIQLVPRQTTFATLLHGSATTTEAMFLLRGKPPPSIAIGGSFIAAEGYICLRRGAKALRMLAEGRLVEDKRCPTFRYEAVQRPWFGEFFEKYLGGDGI